MSIKSLIACAAVAVLCAGASRAGASPVSLDGSLKTWDLLTLSFQGPRADEADTQPNPFLDYRLSVDFWTDEDDWTETDDPVRTVQGFFAADGDAANTSATAGDVWRVRFVPYEPGLWHYRVHFVSGSQVAINGGQGAPVAGLDGLEGTFTIAPARGERGRLAYTGQRYLRWKGSNTFFLKAGADAPETLLAYADIDGTEAHKASVPLKTWGPHVQDWRPGDPQWKDGKGHGLIGALNYLAAQGMNCVSCLLYNAGGDGDNVWPFIHRDDKLHYDVSKLAQWDIVFAHGNAKGLLWHFKLQETENDDNRPDRAPTSLDGGALGTERKLYLREMLARFGWLRMVTWNLGEENSQTTQEQQAMADYIRSVSPYPPHIVLHTFPGWQERVYNPLLGTQTLTGASIQTDWANVHAEVLKWVKAAEATRRPWVVCSDETGPADVGVPPYNGYEGFHAPANTSSGPVDLGTIRRYVLWGTLMAGGGGVQYYFGYALPQNDLLAEDFRSREPAWHDAAMALHFFQDDGVPYWMMEPADGLVVAGKAWVLAQPHHAYVVYLPEGGPVELNLGPAPVDVQWFDPRNGGPLQPGTVAAGAAGVTTLVPPASAPGDDWAALIHVGAGTRHPTLRVPRAPE